MFHLSKELFVALVLRKSLLFLSDVMPGYKNEELWIDGCVGRLSHELYGFASPLAFNFAVLVICSGEMDSIQYILHFLCLLKLIFFPLQNERSE